jgi:hypothetical protein
VLVADQAGAGGKQDIPDLCFPLVQASALGPDVGQLVDRVAVYRGHGHSKPMSRPSS